MTSRFEPIRNEYRIDINVPFKVQERTMLVRLTGMVLANFIRSRQQGRVEHIIVMWTYQHDRFCHCD